jgi:hypothetical protein
VPGAHEDELPPASLQTLAATSGGQLRALFERGERPDPAALAGWEFRGVNMPATLPKLLGIRRFIKGFVSEADGGTVGYNEQVVGSELDLPWTVRPQRDGRERYAYFAVLPVDARGRAAGYRNAVLFDYGAVAHPERGLASRLRDHVVRVVPGSDDLLLGRALLAVGRWRIPVGWFAIQRAQPVPSSGD